MLFRQETLAGIAAGEIDLAFRRWPRARVKVGTGLRTAIGVLEVVSIEVVDPKRIGARGSGDVHRIRVRRAGEDPRIALRGRAALSADERADLERRLEGMAGARAVLALIGAKPGVRAAELAASLGRELRPFKAGVRRLKELGLTESLEVGYRLSPRGRALLRARASGAK